MNDDTEYIEIEPDFNYIEQMKKKPGQQQPNQKSSQIQQNNKKRSAIDQKIHQQQLKKKQKHGHNETPTNELDISNKKTPTKANNSTKQSPANVKQTQNPTSIDLQNSNGTTSDKTISISDIEKATTAYNPNALFEWLIAPMKPADFFSQYWEKKPLIIRRSDPSYYSKLFSKQSFDEHVKKGEVTFENGVNVTKYDQKKGRVGLNGEGVASFAYLDKCWKEGASFQVLNPQQYQDQIWELNSTLEDLFGCLVGSNSYITPPHSQALAPHYDDIEAFVLQLEGSKSWKLYNPTFALPDEYSKDLKHSEIGAPTHDIKLESGDLMYFPRGVIHEARATTTFSHHLTVSTYQKTSFTSLMQFALPLALQKAFQNDVNFRRGLPINTIQFFGKGVSKKGHQQEVEKLEGELNSFVQNLASQYINWDSAVDHLSEDFVVNRLPPYPLKGISRQDIAAKQSSVNANLNSEIRVLYPGWIRAYTAYDNSLEKEVLILKSCIDNNRHSNMGEQKRDTQNGNSTTNSHSSESEDNNNNDSYTLDISFKPAILFLLESFPKFVSVKSLPQLSSLQQPSLASALIKQGFAIVKQKH